MSTLTVDEHSVNPLDLTGFEFIAKLSVINVWTNGAPLPSHRHTPASRESREAPTHYRCRCPNLVDDIACR